MLEFEYFLKTGDVKLRHVDTILVDALILDSDDRYRFLKTIALNDDNSRYIVENAYDVMRTLIEAKLALFGYKSYSHEATILFLKKFPQFKDSEILLLDNLRKIRHGIKYSARNTTVRDAEEVLRFTEEMKKKIEEIR